MPAAIPPTSARETLPELTVIVTTLVGPVRVTLVTVLELA